MVDFGDPAGSVCRRQTMPACPALSDARENGAHIRTRTGDLFLTKEVLYLLSYVGFQATFFRRYRKLERETGLEPATLSLEG